MRALALTLSLCLCTSVALAQAPDFTWTEITAPYTRGANAYFGSGLAWDGERLVVRSDTRLDVYRFDGISAPVYEAQLVPLTSPSMGFPGSIAIDHGRVLTTANGDPPVWALYEFALTGTTWAEAARLVNPMPTPGDGAFVRIVMDGARWATSEPYIGTNRGSVDLIHASGSGPFTWTTTNRTMILGPTNGELTGHTLLLRGDELLVTTLQAYVSGVQAGRVTLYRDTGTALSQIVSIDNPTPGDIDQFGDCTDMDANFIYIGAHHDDTTATDAGAFYVYDRAGVLRQTILGTSANGAFGGGTVDVEGEYLVLAAPTNFAFPGVGHLLLYRRDATGTWVQRADIADFAGMPRSYFGSGARIIGHTIVVSSGAATVGGVTNAGRVWWGTFSEPDGRACSADADCTHGHCVSGICCNTACSGACDACGTGSCVTMACDAGTMPDAGQDAGTDAAMSMPDTGVDAGPANDAATPADAGAEHDAGHAPSDGAMADASSNTDAGAVPRIPLSCTCRAAAPAPSHGALVLLGLVLTALWRRRR